MTPPMRSSPVFGATYMGRYRLSGNAWEHVVSGVDDLHPEPGHAFGCYETAEKGLYDVWLEPLSESKPPPSRRRFSFN